MPSAIGQFRTPSVTTHVIAGLHHGIACPTDAANANATINAIGESLAGIDRLYPMTPVAFTYVTR